MSDTTKVMISLPKHFLVRSLRTLKLDA